MLMLPPRLWRAHLRMAAVRYDGNAGATPAGWVEQLLVMYVLLILASAGQDIVRLADFIAGTPGSAIGEIVVRAAQVPAYVGISVLLALWRRQLIAAVLAEPLIIIVPLVALASVLWSEVPARSFANGIRLLALTLFAFYFAARFPPREQLELCGRILGPLLIMGVVVSLTLPALGLETNPKYVGAWRGSAATKNLFGWLAGLTLVASVALVVSRPHRRFALTLAGISSLVLWQSRSRGSLLAAVIAISFCLLAPTLSSLYRRARQIGSWAVALAGGLLGLVLVALSPVLLWMVGRDWTLTSRVPLWQSTATSILKRPFLGYGFEVFWLPCREAEEVMRAYAARSSGNPLWNPYSAHNGWLEVALGLGLLGLVPMLALTLVAIVRVIRMAAGAGPAIARIWVGGVTVYVLMINIVESTFLRILTQGALLWFLFAAATVWLGKNRRHLDAGEASSAELEGRPNPPGGAP